MVLVPFWIIHILGAKHILFRLCHIGMWSFLGIIQMEILQEFVGQGPNMAFGIIMQPSAIGVLIEVWDLECRLCRLMEYSFG